VSGAIKPIIMNRLISLRHLYAHPNTIDFLSGIGSLTNLQELEEFHVLKQKGNTISELMDILAISGQLVIRYLNNVSSKEEAINTKDEEKRHLRSLSLIWGGCYYGLPNESHGDTLGRIKPLLFSSLNCFFHSRSTREGLR
jgi:hypothetical protein